VKDSQLDGAYVGFAKAILGGHLDQALRPGGSLSGRTWR
jgi:hypothetical protein